MNDLPIPTGQAGTNQFAPPVITQAVPQMSSDPKQLLDRAIEQVDQIIAQTVSDPSRRADEIQALKAAYLKARYNVEVGQK